MAFHSPCGILDMSAPGSYPSVRAVCVHPSGVGLTPREVFAEPPTFQAPTPAGILIGETENCPKGKWVLTLTFSRQSPLPLASFSGLISPDQVAQANHQGPRLDNLSIRLRQVSVHWGEGRRRAGGR